MRTFQWFVCEVTRVSFSVLSDLRQLCLWPAQRANKQLHSLILWFGYEQRQINLKAFGKSNWSCGTVWTGSADVTSRDQKLKQFRSLPKPARVLLTSELSMCLHVPHTALQEKKLNNWQNIKSSFRSRVCSAVLWQRFSFSSPGFYL